MSASPVARQAGNLTMIPTRRVVIDHENEMPTDYGTTPGGTIFGTTPGGTRIVYERAFLMQMRQSPLARTPPANLPVIPGVTAPSEKENKKNAGNKKSNTNNGQSNQGEGRTSPSKGRGVPYSIKEEENEQFSMDM